MGLVSFFNVNSTLFQVQLIILKMNFVAAAVMLALYTPAASVSEERREKRLTPDQPAVCKEVCVNKECEMRYNSRDGDWYGYCEGRNGNIWNIGTTTTPDDGTCGYDEKGDRCCFENGGTQCTPPQLKKRSRTRMDGFSIYES